MATTASGALAQSRTRALSASRKELVEHAAGHRQPEAREVLEGRPRQLERDLPRVDPQPMVPLERVILGLDAHLPERDDGARGQPVATDLLARERRPFEERDVDPVAGQVVGRRGTPWAGADDQNVGLDLRAR